MDNIWQAISAILTIAILFFLVILPLATRGRANRRLIERFQRIQRRRKSRLIAIVHRQEGMGILGIPSLRHIDLNDAEEVLEAIRRTPPNKPLEIILHTPGGLVLAALQIARAIKAHPARKTVFVPHYAMSGGTLIALAADEIVLSKHAVLGPIDPQVGGVPAASLVKITDEKSIDATDDVTLILADVGRKALEQMKRAACELMEGTMSEDGTCGIASELASGRWTHDYPITVEEARELGLNVSTDMPAEIMELMSLFPETLRRVPAVRYVDGRPAPMPPAGTSLKI